MTHYNTDQLRDYCFGLLDEPETSQVAAHLETCVQCRSERERIEQQFAALDVLNEQPEVSETLLNRVLNPNTPSRRVLPFRKAVLLAAAAGIAIVIGVLQIGNNAEDNIRIADGGSSMEGQAPSRPDETTIQRSSLQPVRAESVSRTQPAFSLDELRAKKPFAPASNIELNVLPRRDDVQLTIYNAEDLTLVREKRILTLKRGWNWLQFMWSNTLIDPTSLELEPKTHTEQIEITQLVYPPRLNELARWSIFSETNCAAEFELTYFTSGLKWNAFYEATLASDEQSMQLKSYVRVDNGSGEDYENAQTRLVVGEINLTEAIANLARRPAYQPQLAFFGSAGELQDKSKTWDFEDVGEMDDLFGGEASDSLSSFLYFKKEILKQALSEYQLYTIEGRETIPDGWGKRLPSINVQNIGITNLYKYDEERWGPDTIHFLSFANTEECQLGENPLPDGRVRVCRTVDAEQRLSYVGAADIKYIPVGDEITLELGISQKVTVEPKLMRIRTDNYRLLKDVPEGEGQTGPVSGDITAWDQITSWKIVLTNTRHLPVELEITRLIGTSDWDIQTDEPYEKYDAHHIRFNVRLEPRSKREIHYELTEHVLRDDL